MLIISKGFVKIYNIGQSAALDVSHFILKRFLILLKVEFTEENFANDWSIVRLHCGDAKVRVARFSLYSSSILDKLEVNRARQLCNSRNRR